MERSSGSFLDGTYRLLTRRNSVNIALIFVGAIVGERVFDYGINKLWHYNNMGKHYEDIPVLGQRMGDE